MPERVREGQRVQAGLARAHSQRASVLAAMLGVSGRARLEARLAGREAPATMAALAKRRRRATLPLREPALPGSVHAHHRPWLAMQRAHIACLDEQLEALTPAMETSLQALRTAAPSREAPPPRLAVSRGPSDAASPPLTFPRAVALLDSLPGIDQRGAAVIVAAIGLDRAQFDTAPRLAAWAGVALGHAARAGKPRAGTTRQGNRPLRAILPPLAHAAVRPQRTYLSALSQRLAARRGKKRAIIAGAHALLGRGCHRLSRQEPYRA